MADRLTYREAKAMDGKLVFGDPRSIEAARLVAEVEQCRADGIKVKRVCPDCAGYGGECGEEDCEGCDGAGWFEMAEDDLTLDHIEDYRDWLGNKSEDRDTE